MPTDGPPHATSADPYTVAAEASEAIAAATGKARHDAAIVLGSGWQEAVEAFGPPDAELVTDGLPGFVPSTVPGHEGRVRSVRIAGHDVLVLVGRVHLYEGHEPATVVHPVRAAVLAGATTVVLTNAAGGIDPTYRPGQAVLLRDHINLMSASPLAGPPPPDPYAGRFVDLSDLYPAPLRSLAADAAAALDLPIAEGVYAAVRGPHYETPAEIVMLRRAGADLVGMSTALEAIAARHLGASVLGVSVVTNPAAGVGSAPLDHADVLATGAGAAPRLGALLRSFVERL